MNEKEAIIIWAEAIEFGTNNIVQALERFRQLIDGKPPSGVAKPYYNIAVLKRLQNDKIAALKALNKCLESDSHNAVAYFQRSTLYYSMEKFVESAVDAQKCVECMRNSTVIDYSQLGLRFKLYQHEAIYNEAACHLALGSQSKCLEALEEAERIISKAELSFQTADVVKTIAMVKGGALYIDVLERGSDRLYNPPKSKLNNIARKDYLGKAKVVSSVRVDDTFSGFVGPMQRALPSQPGNTRPLTPQPLSPNLPASSVNETPPRPGGTSVNGKPPRPEAAPVAHNVLLPNTHLSELSAVVLKKRPPNLPVKPKPCVDITLIAGEEERVASLTSGTPLEMLIELTAQTFVYDEGTFSLWYKNREGSYTAVDSASAMEHVWKRKVKDNAMVIYVFGV